VWQLTHLGATAACQRRLAARRCTGAVAGLWAIPPWHGAYDRACGKPTHPFTRSPGTGRLWDVVEAVHS